MPTTAATELSPDNLEQYRRELTGYCYRMLGSGFEADDAVQETMLRAWRAADGFEGRSSVRSWLYRIATNICLDMLRGRQRRALPIDLGPASPPVEALLGDWSPDDIWISPISDAKVMPEHGDPAEIAVARDTIRLAFVTALQRARATLAALPEEQRPSSVDPDQSELLARYVDAFQRYDMDQLVTLLHDDALMTMPPYSFWVRGAGDIIRWMQEPSPSACRDSIMVPAGQVNGSPAWAQYKPDPSGGHAPWALQVHEVSDGRLSRLTFFLETERIFPAFGLPPHLG